VVFSFLYLLHKRRAVIILTLWAQCYEAKVAVYYVIMFACDVQARWLSSTSPRQAWLSFPPCLKHYCTGTLPVHLYLYVMDSEGRQIADA